MCCTWELCTGTCWFHSISDAWCAHAAHGVPTTAPYAYNKPVEKRAQSSQSCTPSPLPCSVTPVIHSSEALPPVTNPPNSLYLGLASLTYRLSSHILSSIHMSKWSTRRRHWPGSRPRRGVCPEGGVNMDVATSVQLPCVHGRRLSRSAHCSIQIDTLRRQHCTAACCVLPPAPDPAVTAAY